MDGIMNGNQLTIVYLINVIEIVIRNIFIHLNIKVKLILNIQKSLIMK